MPHNESTKDRTTTSPDELTNRRRDSIPGLNPLDPTTTRDPGTSRSPGRNEMYPEDSSAAASVAQKPMATNATESKRNNRNGSKGKNSAVLDDGTRPHKRQEVSSAQPGESPDSAGHSKRNSRRKNAGQGDSSSKSWSGKTSGSSSGSGGGEAYLAFLQKCIKDQEEEANRETQACSPCLPTLRSVRFFLGIYAALFWTRSFLQDYTNGVLATIQKRYQIPHSELEVAVGMERVGMVLTLLFVAFYGNKVHKPASILAGCVLCAIGTILLAVPYFIQGAAPPMNVTDSGISLYQEAGLCQAGKNQSLDLRQCDQLRSTALHTEEAFSLLACGKLAVGVGTAFFATLGFAYVQDHVPKTSEAVYYGRSGHAYEICSIVTLTVSSPCMVICKYEC